MLQRNRAAIGIIRIRRDGNIARARGNRARTCSATLTCRAANAARTRTRTSRVCAVGAIRACNTVHDAADNHITRCVQRNRAAGAGD